VVEVDRDVGLRWYCRDALSCCSDARASHQQRLVDFLYLGSLARSHDLEIDHPRRFGVGTRIATPSSISLQLRHTSPIAFGGTVDVGNHRHRRGPAR